MRILSKHKDYYDYYQGIFGIDNNKVYDRRELEIVENLGIADHVQTLKVCISGKEYTLHYYKEEMYYYPEDIVKMNKILNKEHKKSNKNLVWYKRRYIRTESLKEIKKDWKPYKEVNYNKKLRRPVVAFKGNSKEFFVPLLSQLKFPKIMDAKEVYIEIESFMGWLVDNPPLPDNQTNENKIVQHGFDLKESFRHRKDD